MNQDDIIRMAWESGLEREDDDSGEWSVYDDELLKFAEQIAAAAAAAEREACAQVCDQEQSQWNADRDGWQSAKDCAAAIRARGEKGNAS